MTGSRPRPAERRVFREEIREQLIDDILGGGGGAGGNAQIPRAYMTFALPD